MDRLKLLSQLDKVARGLRSMGLAPLTRMGRNVVDKGLPGGLEVNVDQFCVAGSILHRNYLSALRDGRKEALMTRLFSDAVDPGMTVLDIGAYLGWYMLLAAEKVGPSGKVYAFEADLRNYPFVVRNIEANGFSTRVVPVQKAVTEKNGTMEVFLHDSDSSTTSLFYEVATSQTTSVDTIGLDHYLEQELTVGVVKMDIEGSEIHALNGMEALIRRSRGLTMFVECNPITLRAAGQSSEALVQKLESLGFEIQIIDEERQSLRPLTSDVHGVRYVNLYCRT